MRLLSIEEYGGSKKEYDAIINNIREDCEKSYHYFFQKFWDSVVQDPLIENWHIKEICDELTGWGRKIIAREAKDYDLLINLSPGESKSTMCSVLFPVWLWINDPTIKVLSSSHSPSLSSDHASLSRDCIRSEAFQQLWGNKVEVRKDRDSMARYENTSGGIRQCTGVASKITGKHFHCIIIDDPIDAKGIITEGVLRDADSHVNKTLSSRKAGGDRDAVGTMLVMQRLHESDPAGKWISDAEQDIIKLKHICLPATNEYDIIPNHLSDNYSEDGLMNPMRTGHSTLDEQRGKLRSIGFACQYGQSPTVPEGNIILEEHLEVVERDELPDDFWKYPIYYFADTSDKVKEANDPTSAIAVSFYNNWVWIIDMVTMKVRFNKKKELLYDFFRKHASQQSTFEIEAKSSGVSLVDSLKEPPYSINANEFKMLKGDKMQRLIQIIGIIESGKVKLVRLGGGFWIDDFIKECKTFPNAKHDECVDLLTMACTKLQRHMVKIRAQEEYEKKQGLR